MTNDLHLNFEGVLGYATADAEEAVHFFEHTLGLPLSAEDGSFRFYTLAGDVTLAVETSGAMAGGPPYLLFSADDLTAAAEHFLQRGCQVGELPWASGAGFLAKTPEGHAVCVIDRASLAADDAPPG